MTNAEVCLMRDSYLYENSTFFRNKLDIRTQEKLDDAESDYVVYRLKDLAINPLPGEYDTEHFLKMHHFFRFVRVGGRKSSWKNV